MPKCKIDKEGGQCCCQCVSLIQDFHHCGTNKAMKLANEGKCICDKPKGWICAPPGSKHAHSGWSQHSCGCELFSRRKSE